MPHLKLTPKKRRRGAPPPDLPPVPTLQLETEWRVRGFSLIAGIDEAGRGAWAGPVMAAAVILPSDRDDLPQVLKGLRDSKKMTANQRQRLHDAIFKVALAIGLGSSDVPYLDKHGVLAATRDAMQQAVTALPTAPEVLLIDAVDLRDTLDYPQQSLYYGDALSLSIAAASVIAKVTRDRLMAEFDRHYDGYNFARHKGYGTRAHREALTRLGPSNIHRRSFKPVAAHVARQLSMLDDPPPT